MAILDSSPLLTIFVVVALGSLLGAIPLGRIRIGAAGALFVGLAMSARFPELGAGMDVVQSLGLALFVYTVGIASGAAFFAQLRRNLSLLLASVVAVFLAAGAALVMGILFGIERPFLASPPPPDSRTVPHSPLSDMPSGILWLSLSALSWFPSSWGGPGRGCAIPPRWREACSIRAPSPWNTP